jgi:hypothetical protein
MTAFGNPLDGVIRNTTEGFNQTDSSLDPTRDFSFGLDPNQYSFAPVGSPDAAAAIDTSGARPLDVQKSFDNQAGGGANNSQASGSGGASADFLDNVLNNYHQSTYHLRFYTKGDSSSGGNGIIIAESGVTGFNIRSLELDVQKGGLDNRNTVSLHFRMTILEPLGASFLDALVLEAGLFLHGCFIQGIR